MSIKSKLIKAYFITMIVTIIIVGILGRKIYKEYINYEYKTFSAEEAEQQIEKVEKLIKSTPKLLLNKEYLEKLGNTLFKETHCMLAVEVNNSFIYNNNITSTKAFQKGLTHLSTNQNNYYYQGVYYPIKQYNIKNNQQNQARIFIVYSTPDMINASFRNKLHGKEIKNLIRLIGVFLIIYLVAQAILTRWVALHIAKPLEQLENGALQIKEGNLDFDLNINNKDEFGRVSDAFNQMRLRLKDSIKQQQRYEENRKELIANISHDLQTPITSIRGYVEGIKDGVANTPEKLEKYLNIINSKADYLSGLIEDLFLFSKLDLKKLPFDFRTVNMRDFIEHCIEDVQLDFEKNNIHILFEYNKDEVYELKIDVDKMRRVCLNILGNSKKYMDKEKGLIHITMRKQTDTNSIIISILDNGIGIPKEQLNKIFDKFYRVDASRNTSKGGSGLGLAICRQIVEGHKGKIWASDPETEGTLIHIQLPQ